MMKFGCNLNMRNSVSEIRDIGKHLFQTGEYHAIEVTYSEHMRHIDTSVYNHEIKALIEAYHPVVSVHISDFNLAEENQILQKAILDEFAYCCQYAASLGSKMIVVHCGSRKQMHISVFHEDGSRQTREEVYCKLWNLSVETMKEACRIAYQYDICVVTENLSNLTLIQSSNQLIDYVQAVAMGNLKIAFDVGHSHMTGHEVSDEVRQCGSLLAHLHLHDNHGENDEHLPIGHGTIAWSSFLKTLKDMEYQGIYLMELYHSDVSSLMESKQKLLTYL